MTNAVLSIKPLGFPWETADPFLFCVHHDDHYPAGNAQLGPSVSLAGRNLGQDFSRKDGFSMYHGEVVPGFPQHPHRGFETVTLVRSGFIDHSDSLGASARFGQGDAQWLTAGKGIVHSEMFPLLQADAPNPVELFQIWLNLPHADKFAEPHFAMLWSQDIPTLLSKDAAGNITTITVVAGRVADLQAPPPPPKSWAARSDADVAIWTLKLAPDARFTLPRAQPGTRRTLYFFRGSSITIAEQTIPADRGVEVVADQDVLLHNGPDESELLLLQGRPIAEPVVQYGPFVMTTRAEIQQAMSDYQRTRFGGWPWPSDAPVHARDAGRFAKHT